MPKVYSLLLVLFMFQFSTITGREYATDPIPKINYFEEGAKRFNQNIDSALHYIQLGIPYYYEQEDWSTYVNCLNALTSCYWSKGNYTKSKIYAQQALDAAEKHLSKEDLAFGSVLNNLAAFAKRKGDYQGANEYYKKCLALKDQPGQEQEWPVFFNNLGSSYRAMGDYYESKRYFLKALATGTKYLDPKDHNITYSLINLASAHQLTGAIDTAVHLYQRAITAINQNTQIDLAFSENYKNTIYLKLAEIAFDRAEEEKFTHYIQQANTSSNLAQNRSPHKAYLLLGRWSLKNKDYVIAEKHFNHALALMKKKYATLGKNTEIGLAYFYLGQTYQKNNQLEKSLTNYQLALAQYAPNFSVTNKLQNPAVENLAIDKNILKILKGKSDIQFASYEQKNDLNALNNACQTYRLAIAMLNRIRRNYLDKASKEILAENAIPIFEGALHTIHTLYSLTKDPELLEELFQITENSKAILLLESINDMAAQGLGGIPDSLLQIEKDLKIDISYYEQQLAKEGRDEKMIMTLESGLFDLKKEHRKLTKTFEEKYPAYYQLKYNTTLVTIKKVQSELQNEQSALIEYFVGVHSIFIFSITKKNAQIIRVPKKKSFDQQIQQLHQLLITPPSIDAAATDFKIFTSYAHQLFQTLLQPLHLPKEIKELIIIPDDILAYIPFEVLLQDSAAFEALDYSPEVLSYLLHQYQISYNYSATLFSRPAAFSQKATKDFIGFAPSFEEGATASISLRDCNDENFFALNCNQEEVEQISELFDGKSLLGNAANRKQFLSEVPNYRIAHFATHSCLDDHNPMENKIIMADDYISNYDLFNLQLNTELSVLSACQTGSGKLMRGEGVMSLSRGFIHAGCPSVLMSLWSVEDCTTMEIMTSFYKNLKAENNKDFSLQAAKKAYLAQSNKLFSHPFYWAPFVQFGKVEAMTFSKAYPAKVGTILGFLLLTLAIFFARRFHFWSYKKN